MRITLAAVGRLKSGPEKDLFDKYARLLRWELDLREVEEKQRLPVSALREKEAARLLDCCPAGAVIVALDERGKGLSSRAFADLLGRWRDDGRADIAFVIGGADGLDDRVRGRAEFVISLGLVTWPHLLMRGLLAEQLYRAQQILAGHPYHRD